MEKEKEAKENDDIGELVLAYANQLISYSQEDKGQVSDECFVTVIDYPTARNRKAVLEPVKKTVHRLSQYYKCDNCENLFREKLSKFGAFKGVGETCKYIHPQVCSRCVRVFIGLLAQEEVNTILSASEGFSKKRKRLNNTKEKEEEEGEGEDDNIP